MDWFRDVISYLAAPAVTAWAGYFFARRKTKAEANSQELANIEKGLSIYRSIISDLEKKVQILSEEVQSLRQQNCSFKKEVDEWRNKFMHLESVLNNIKNNQ